VADFGISKLVGKKFLMTVNENFTPPYSSLEQLKKEPALPAFDIWSVGIIFYELINGVRPYEIKS
jgi:serine/threonine protein kinase